MSTTGSSTADLGADLLAWSRYIQWQLNAPDFQHTAYPVVAVKKSTQLAVDFAAKKGSIDANAYQVNPPYTPKIKALGLCYSASVEIVMANYLRGARTTASITFTRSAPARSCPCPIPTAPATRCCLATTTRGSSTSASATSNRRRALTLLFQMAEGSANPDLEATPIRWSYLSGDDWKDFGASHVLSDTTRGLINSGIVELDIGSVKPNTWLPGDLAWIRAAVARNADAACDTVAIHAQAVPVTFVDPGGDPRHYDQPLSPGTITGLAEPMADIAGIRQPYSSFGGSRRGAGRLLQPRQRAIASQAAGPHAMGL